MFQQQQMVIRRFNKDEISLTRKPGMFIFATLVMNNLLSQISRKKLRKEMQEIPTTLDQVYVPTYLMSRIHC